MDLVEDIQYGPGQKLSNGYDHKCNRPYINQVLWQKIIHMDLTRADQMNLTKEYQDVSLSV